MRFLVRDEDGLAIRRFHTKAEAVRFLQAGWTIEVRKPAKPDLMAELGEARW